MYICYKYTHSYKNIYLTYDSSGNADYWVGEKETLQEIVLNTTHGKNWDWTLSHTKPQINYNTSSRQYKKICKDINISILYI